MKDIVIIGAGASGMTAAITAARRGKAVTLIERNDKLGKKLLITGNGKCNYWNEDQNINHYHSSNEELLDKIINLKNEEKVKSFFSSLGIIPKTKNGYYYPFSEQAPTINNALIYELKKLNVEILKNITVEKIVKEDVFIINPEKENIKTKKLIIASGSKAAPKTGSDGIGYDLAQSLGHKIIRPLPALVSLKGNEPYFKKWSGVRTDAIISLYEDDKFIKKEKGQLQLTDYGISGIAVFNLSRYISIGLKNHKEIVKINFLPFLKENPKKFINKQIKLGYPIKETLERFLNYKLVEAILQKSKIKTNSFNNINEKALNTLIKNLTEFDLVINETNTFEKSQVCSGGIPLNEINLETMESKKTNNLFLIGEIIDIDGDCGGYNLAVAWITGICAGENI